MLPTLDNFFASDLKRDMAATAITMTICVMLIKSIDLLVYLQVIGGKLSRKMVHILTGPVYLLCWNLFSASGSAKYFCAIVPLLVTLQFASIGLGIIKDDATVATLSRSGDRRDLLFGPVFYGLVFVVCTVWFWRHSVGSIVRKIANCSHILLVGTHGHVWWRWLCRCYW